MTTRFLRGVAVLVPLLLLAACAGKKEAPPEKRDTAAKIFDVRGDGKRTTPDGEEKCAPVYQQSGIHPYNAMREGLPNTELCVVATCTKCGAVLHECQAKARRRR